MAILESRVPIAPIHTIDKALADPQTLSRNMVVEIDYGKEQKLKILGNPIKMSEVEQEVFKEPPRLGEHTEEVLTRILNYSTETIGELKQQKII